MDISATRGRRDYAVLLALLVLCVGGGALIGIAFAGQTATYQQFELPPWAPPSWLFGPVWTLLYILMAVSAWGGSCSRPRSTRRSPSDAHPAAVAHVPVSAIWVA